MIADKSLNGVPEFALGVTPWCEAGLYLPLYDWVIDANVKGWDVETGIGAGLTRASDRLTLKLILARDLARIWRP